MKHKNLFFIKLIVYYFTSKAKKGLTTLMRGHNAKNNTTEETLGKNYFKSNYSHHLVSGSVRN